MAKYEEVIAEMAEILGMEGLEPDGEGVCELISEEADVVIMDCPEADGTVLVAAKVMDAPEGEMEAFRAALEANHALAGRLGAAVSLDPEDGSLVLALYRPLEELDGRKMVEVVEEFTSALLSLRAALGG